VTCSNLTDLSRFPLNTNVEFTNIFDNQIDFARVDYLALEYMLVTTAPPPPPTVVQVRLAGGAPNVQLAVNWAGMRFVATRTTNTVGTNEGNLKLNVSLSNGSLPQFGTGDPLNSPTLVEALAAEYNDFFSAPDLFDVLPLDVTDAGSFGTYVKLAPAVAGARYPSQMGTLRPLPVGLVTVGGFIDGAAGRYADGVFTYSTIPPNMLAVQPVSTWDRALVHAALPSIEGNLLQAWPNGCFGIKNDSVPPTVNGTIALEAVMSDSSVIALGTWQLTVGVNRPSWPSSTGSQRLVMGLPWPNFEYGDNYDGLGVIYGGGPPPLNAIGDHVYVPPAHSNLEFYHGPQLAPYDYSSDPGAASTLVRLLSAQVTQISGPVSTTLALPDPRCAPRYERASGRKRRKALVGSTPTYDNLVQIICDELEVDRTAGAYSTQLLAVVPFNFAALTTGYYEIRVPVNSLVWRRLADVHLRTLTFGLFNGLGELHPSLLGQPFNVTLGLRYL